ncbi:hypothetical protein [Clostridium intestinale]|nr:hypothetical protein [Clostridium intestinale]
MNEWLIVNGVYFGGLIGLYAIHKRDIKKLRKEILKGNKKNN